MRDFANRPVTNGQFFIILALIMLGAVWFGLTITSYQHNACLNRAEIIDRSNAQATAFIEIERENPVAAQSTIDRRIKVWDDSILPPLVC